MGWSSWQMFNRFVNETDIQESILALAALKEYGYEYANFDGAWMNPQRDPITRKQMPNSMTVPHGIKPLADLAHANGIKFGLYSAVGNVTCQGNPGSWGYETLDAQQYADWGVDYLKIDSCGGTPNQGKDVDVQRRGFERMRDALNATGRPIFINTCGMYGVTSGQEANSTSECTIPGEPGGAAYTNDVDGWRDKSHLVANSWLIEWANNLNSFFQAPCGRGWLTILDANEDLTKPEWSSPGGWNDMDIMSVGCSDAEKERGTTHTDCNNGHQTLIEQASQFALWCMKNAPLILGGDLRNLTPEIYTIITNKEMIALDQDLLGMPARIVYQGGSGGSGGGSGHSRVLLEARACNESDVFQQWEGAVLVDALKKISSSSSIRNAGTNKCLTTTWSDPVTVGSCDEKNATMFLARPAECPGAKPGDLTLEVLNGTGDGGYGGRCLDLDHGVGPDIDLWACHPPTHPDAPHQVYSYDAHSRLLHAGSNAGSDAGMSDENADDLCLGLYSDENPDRTLTIFTKKLFNPKSPRAVALFNRGGTKEKMTLLREHLLLDGMDCLSVSLRDLEKHVVVAQNLTSVDVLRTVVVESHQTVVWLVECEEV